MKTAIAKAFYDKEVSVLERITETDAEGGVKVKGDAVKETFKGNVSFSNCEKIQEAYGLDYKVSVSITTDYNGVNIADILAYNGVKYEVKGIYPKDSHRLILGAKWRK